MPYTSENRIVAQALTQVRNYEFFASALREIQRDPRTILASYTQQDFRKIYNLFLVLIGEYRSEEIFRRGHSSNDIYFVLSAEHTQELFGCSPQSLRNSLNRTFLFYRNHFPLNVDNRAVVVNLHNLTARRNVDGYLRNEITSIEFRVSNFASTLNTVNGTLAVPRRSISRFRQNSRSMPTRNIQIEQISVDNSALLIDAERENQLNNQFQTNLSSLLQNIRNEQVSYPDELSNYNIEQFVTNAISTHAERMPDNIRRNQAQYVLATVKILQQTANCIRSANNRPTNQSVTEMPVQDGAIDWRRGFVTQSSSNFNVGIRFKRQHIEEWFRVGNRGRLGNRTRLNREINDFLRELNIVFATFGASITTHRIAVQGEESGEDRTARIFVVQHAPYYGMIFTMGVSPLARQTNEQTQTVPAFFSNPYHNLGEGLTAIFNYLRGREPILQEPVLTITQELSPEFTLMDL